VKVVVDQNEHVMALSRLPIPFSWGKEAVRLRHLGLYAFRGDALENFTSRVRGPLEQAERIEMYRFLEYGDAIVLAQVDQAAPAVDVPEDVEKIRDYL
jgi:3-deoxy-manno-octulosonate cytidylyltransferase (CMP-KDO synthetase)